MLAPGDLLNITTVAYHDPTSQIGVNDWGFVVSAIAGGAAGPQDLATILATDWVDAWRAWNSDTVTFAMIGVRVINPATGKTSDYGEDPPAVSGLLATPPGIVPSQVSPVVRVVSTYGTRSGRGRRFLPFMSNAWVNSDGRLTAGGVTALNAWVNAVIATQTHTTTGGVDITIAPRLLHRKPLPVSGTPIISAAVTGSLGTQRRRGDYGRPNASPI